MPHSNQLAWVAVDWGTSHVRVWLMDATGEVIRQAQSDKGMGALETADYEPTLLEMLGDDLSGPVPVIICGMAGSRQGWAEAPYSTVPCKAPSLEDATQVETQDARLQVYILPGIKQMSPADVMRGEETQIRGFLAENPKFDGILCLPGTHTKWVHISAEEVVSFRTFMTGEMFALLGEHSVLRHSVATDGWDETAYLTAIDDAMSRPASMAAELFSLRAEGLLNGMSAETARARLSGLLIGAELAAARPYWLGQEVVVLGAAGIAQAYHTGLQAQGAFVRTVPADELTLAGLRSACSKLESI